MVCLEIKEKEQHDMQNAYKNITITVYVKYYQNQTKAMLSDLDKQVIMTVNINLY